MGTKKEKEVKNSSSKQVEEEKENALTLEEKIYNIFDEAQKSVGVHRVLLRKLINIVENNNGKLREESMKIILRGCLDRVMFVSKKEPAVERIVKFYCNFMINTSTTNDTFIKGMEHLLMRSLGQDKTVRFRAIQIIATILTDMSSDADLDENLWHSLGTIITPRLRDRAPNVRLWAVQAVGRLQNPEDDDNYLIAELLRLMCTDTSTDIRIAAVETICICSQSLPGVVERIRDIQPDVRCAAINALRKAKVGVRHLNTALRAQIVQYGLNDREEKVKYSTRALIFSWIDSNDLNSNVPKLFHYLNLHSNKVDANQAERHCQYIAFAIMHELDKALGSSIVTVSKELRRCARDSIPNWNDSIDNNNIDVLTPADLLWAVGRCEYAAQCFNTGSSMELNDALIPDTLKVCDMLLLAHGSKKSNTQIGKLIITSRNENSNNYILQISPQRQLVVKYLLRMSVLKLNDSGHDVDGKMRLALVCNHMLSDAYLPSSLVLPVLTTLLATDERDNVLIATARLCSSLYDQIKALCVAEEDEDDNNDNNDNNENDSIIETNEEDNEKLLLKSEEYMTASVVRAMEIAAWVFQQTLSVGDITKLNSSVITLVRRMTPMIWESLQQSDTDLRRLAIKCLGLLATASAAGMTPINDINSSDSSSSNDDESHDDESMPWKSMGLQERDILLSSAMMVEEEKEIRCTAVSGLCDILCVHNMVTGMRQIEENDEKMNISGVMTATQEHKESVRVLLIELVNTPNDNNDEAIRCTALEAASKLLLSGVFHCPILLSLLCQAFYTPSSMFGDSAVTTLALNDDNDLLISSAPLTGTQAHLQQSLSLFFSLYATTTLSVNHATTTPVNIIDDSSSSSSNEKDVPLVLLIREFQRRQQTVVSSISLLLTTLYQKNNDSNNNDSSSRGSSIVHACKCLSELVTSFEVAWSDFQQDCSKFKLKNSSSSSRYTTARDIVDAYIPVDLLKRYNCDNNSCDEQLYKLKEKESQLYNLPSVIHGSISACCMQLLLSSSSSSTSNTKLIKTMTKEMCKVIDNMDSSWLDSNVWSSSSTSSTSMTVSNACKCILSVCILDKTSEAAIKRLKTKAEQVTKKFSKTTSSSCEEVNGLTLSIAAPDLVTLIANITTQIDIHDSSDDDDDDDEEEDVIGDVESTRADVDADDLTSHLQLMTVDDKNQSSKTKKATKTTSSSSSKSKTVKDTDKENSSNNNKTTKSKTTTKAKITKTRVTKAKKEEEEEEEVVVVSSRSSRSARSASRAATEKMRLVTMSVEDGDSD